MEINSVTGLLTTSQLGQHGKVALISGVGTTMRTSVGHSGAACSGMLGSVYTSKYNIWSEDSSAYLSLDSARLT